MSVMGWRLPGKEGNPEDFVSSIWTANTYSFWRWNLIVVRNMNTNRNIGMPGIPSNRPANNCKNCAGAGTCPNTRHSIQRPRSSNPQQPSGLWYKRGALKGQHSVAGSWVVKRATGNPTKYLPHIKMALKYRHVVQLSPALIRCPIKMTNTKMRVSWSMMAKPMRGSRRIVIRLIWNVRFRVSPFEEERVPTSLIVACVLLVLCEGPGSLIPLVLLRTLSLDYLNDFRPCNIASNMKCQ